MRSFTEILAHLVENNHIKNVTDLARQLGEHSQTVSGWKTRPSFPVEKIIAYCEHRGLDIREVLLGDDEAFSEAELRAAYWEQEYKVVNLVLKRARSIVAKTYGEDAAKEIFIDRPPPTKVSELYFGHPEGKHDPKIGLAEPHKKR
ncbi:MAG: helix-turn-helix domain-containing protein [Candidatus Marinimicrobia bacterium]|nr:helix-turn-helix domain-containing protein [Candidatus Neomarinimicrobiota bacterium]